MHDLTDEIPRTVQIAVPRGTRAPRITYPPVQVHHFNAAPGESVPAYSPARTVVDLMRLRHRIGEPLALVALRRYLSSPGSRPGHLLDLARDLDVLGPLRSALDVLEAS